jgi:hypothetical protein
VPEIAIEISYLASGNGTYVIDWANQSLQWNNRLSDGSAINVSGTLEPILYNKTTGSTYPIYYSNANGLWNPQPGFQIQNATLTAELAASTCTTTLTFTVSGPPNGTWNLPMIPAGACYTLNNVAQQPQATSNTGTQTPPSIVAIAGVAAFAIATFVLTLLKKRKHAAQPRV